MGLEKNPKARIAIFASGTGTNAGAIMGYFQNNSVAEVVLLLTNNPEALALQRAKQFHVPAKIFNKQQFESGQVLQWVREAGATHLALAGFLWLIPTSLIQAFPDHIINIHPSLLPKFSGKGMYGLKVHEAVKTSGEEKTGITIHLVNEHYDDGKILFQATCAVGMNDTAETIAKRVHQLEYEHYPKVIEGWLGSAT